MKITNETYGRIYNRLLSKETKDKSEKIIVFIAIVSFVIHILLIGLAHFGLLPFGNTSALLGSPVAAIYTPFSFILIYEVYLLVYYLPSSITRYIGKQYEIITLIIIRRNFKDLSHLEFTQDWFNRQNDLQFTYDIIATIVLFALILLFYKLSKDYIANKPKSPTSELSPEISKFINTKKTVAAALVPILLILAVYSFATWGYETFFSMYQNTTSISDVNKIFYLDFFTVLIFADVLLLLFSFINTDEFHKVIRNSGFVISTVLIKLSFDADGLLNTILIVSAVLFGVLILAIHNQFDKQVVTES